jgi:PKD repeat protein
VTPVGATVNSELGPSSSSISGQTVQFRASDGRDAFGRSDEEIPLGEVTLRGATTGAGAVELVDAVVDDDDGRRVTLRLDRNCGQIRTVSGCPTVDGVESSDPDGDGLCEDLNGNGRTDFDDVNTLFDNLQSSDVRDNVSAFDFNGNGRIDFDDVNTLFEEIG